MEQPVEDISGIPRKRKHSFSKNRRGTKEGEKLFADFLKREQILQINQYMEQETFEFFEREMKSFVRQIREFDRELSIEQIWQAMRNYLIFSMIVELQGEKQQAGKPILGYSLLYPYTDNYIDDVEKSAKEKEDYNRLIGDRIRGFEVKPGGALEEKTVKLLEEIEDSYCGEQLEQIRCVLLSLLEAQHQSIKQQEQGRELLTTEQILDISVYKGGTSVLADYFFSTREWNRGEEEFYLKFGLLLQLVDDLQDRAEDDREGSRTLMTEAAREGRLEQLANQLMWFAKEVISGFTPHSKDIKPFVLRHCVSVTMIAVAMSQDDFSKKYIRRMEEYLPFSLKFFKKISKKQSGSPAPDKRMIDNQMRLLDILVSE